MTGFIKVEAIGGEGISVHCSLKEVGLLEKAAILAGVFQGLEINTNNVDEVSMYTALATMLAKNGTTIKADNNMVELFKKVAERRQKQSEEETEEEDS